VIIVGEVVGLTAHNAIDKTVKTMIRRLLLVRHGRIEAGHQGQFIGATDPALDASGESQVRALADRVQRFRPEVCYCSPLQRCRQTASPMVPDLPTRFENRLREIDFGEWERRTFEDVARDHPAQVAQWAEFVPASRFRAVRSGDFVQRVRGGGGVALPYRRTHVLAHPTGA